MPKINVYLPQGLAEAVRNAALPVSEICQRALSDAVGGKPMSAKPKIEARSDWWKYQTYEDRAKDLERAAAAIRYALSPTSTVPVSVKPIGAASALAALRSEDPSLLQWEHNAQDVTGWAAAIEVANELNAPAEVLALLQDKLSEAQAILADTDVSNRFGPTQEVLDLVAELQERAHPQTPR